MIMSLEELDRELLSDEERLVSSLEEYKNAKTMLRKARITSISNKLLAPYRRFRIEQAIAKYDAMIERIENKREKEIRRAEKLQEKEEKRENKQAKADFKAALREKRKEDIVNFVDEKKSNVINFGKEIGSKVSRVSSFVVSVKNSAIKKMKENTTIDLTIKMAIEDTKLKNATNRFNKVLEQKKEVEKKEKEQAREQELSDAIKFDEDIKADYKERDIPFANIQEKIDKARKDKSYMGKATNRAIDYFRKKKDSLDDKVFNARANMAYASFVVGGKVSRAKSKVVTMFNIQLDHFKDKYDTIMQERNIKKSEKIQLASDKERLKQRKKDMIAALREQEEKNISIKRAQLDSMREAIGAVNSTGDIFANAPGLDVGRAMK